MPQFQFIAQPLLYSFIKGIEEVFLSNWGSQKTHKIHLTDWIYTHIFKQAWSPVLLCRPSTMWPLSIGIKTTSAQDLPNSKASRYPNTGILLFIFFAKIPPLTLLTQISTLVAYLLWTAKSELKPFTYFIQATEVDDTELWNNRTAWNLHREPAVCQKKYHSFKYSTQEGSLTNWSSCIICSSAQLHKHKFNLGGIVVISHVRVLLKDVRTLIYHVNTAEPY